MDLHENSVPSDELAMGCAASMPMHEDHQAPPIRYEMVIRDKHGNVKSSDIFENLVTTAGKNDVLDKYFKGSAYTAAWYLGLKGSGSAAVGDTLASHAGWTEITAYSGNRPAITWGTSSGGSNTATALVFTMNASYTVAGAFIGTVATGTSGTLYSAGDAATARSGGSGDTITITPTVSFS